MSVADIIQAFGWIPVGWLLTVHLLIRFGRLPRHGTAVRVAGFAAAITIVAAALSTRMWPIAVLGFLFMRTEFFGHRHHDEREAHRVQALLDRFRRHPLDDDPHASPLIPGARAPEEELVEDHRIHHGPSGVSPAHTRHPEYTVPGMTAASATTLRTRTHEKNDPDFVPASVGLREGHHVHPEPEPPSTGMKVLKSAKHFTDVLLKLEIIAMVVIALVLFGIWAEGQREEFTRTTDDNICEMSFSC